MFGCDKNRVQVCQVVIGTSLTTVTVEFHFIGVGRRERRIILSALEIRQRSHQEKKRSTVEELFEKIIVAQKITIFG